MRISIFLRTVPLILTLALPALVRAQFQEPTQDELKMTDDPKAPGAAAVYLNIVERADDVAHVQTYYARIKVLQEKGKELATVNIPYLRHFLSATVMQIKGRTIHSDGTEIPLTTKVADLLDAKDRDFQINRKVFTLPSVEVGSILEYRYEIHYEGGADPPDWEVQRNYFVHSAHYDFTPSREFLKGAQSNTDQYLVNSKGQVLDSLDWLPILPAGVKVETDASGKHSLDVTDIPAAPDEEYMPPLRGLLYKVDFYYSPGNNAKDFWINGIKDWSKGVNHFAEESKSIKQAAAGMVAPTDSELDKAKKIYAAVQALDNTDFSRAKSESELKVLKLKEAKRAEDTLSQKSGSSEDIAMLYLALARAAGISADAMKVVDRSEGSFDQSYMSFSQFDATIVLLNIGGQTIYVDPGEKMCPFGVLNWKHSNAVGIIQAEKEQKMGPSPPQDYRVNTLLRRGNLLIDAHGGVAGSFQIVMNGQRAMYWRQEALLKDMDEVKKEFDRDLEEIAPQGVEAHIDHFLAIDNPDVNLMAMVKVSGSLGTATSKRLLLPGFFFEARGHSPFVKQETRLTPVDMHYGETTTEEIVYHLPDGFTVEGAPGDANNLWANHAVFVVKTAAEPGQITIARVVARAFDQAKPEEYQDLRGFYQKIAANDLQQLVLSASAAAKGN